MPSAWDHVRAGLIAAHIAAITVAAVPTPDGELAPDRKRDPQVLAALDPWTGLVVALGLADDEAGAVDWLFEAGSFTVNTRRAAVAPIKDYLRLTGNAQSWRMFGVAPAKQARLEIHGRRAGSDAWEPLYIEHGGYDWGWVLLDHSRVRALRSSFATREQRPRYSAFARWVGRWALEEHLELERVRIQYGGFRIPPAAELRREGLGEMRPFWPIEIDRATLEREAR